MTESCPVPELKTGPSKREGACSILSQRAAEPLTGTAFTDSRWLLVEHPGPWPSQAVDTALPAETLAEVRDRAPGVRLALIRRPQARSVDAPVAFLAGGRPDAWLRRVQLQRYGDLVDLDLEAIADGREPADGERITEPTFFVCTHGRREVCCAEFGRPVMRAIATGGFAPWEITHIGGDRFAASMVVFPLGHYFGHLNPVSGLSAARKYATDRLQLGNVRGRSGYPNSVQTAELFLRERLSALGLHDATVLSWHERDEQAGVDIRVLDDHYRVELTRQRHPEQLVNGCSDDAVRIPRWYWVAKEWNKLG
ncbi:sucrase ferredoxin [uncultured Agrococcus sp.]|uniref:sucrase ferredoxin n=1 Tax=uncultured Agrococcus sp. TaxID=382258 RepID=UPI0025EF454F|nr:sucrase ferredoxin [uncultured Agrococcus sp.]